MLGGMFFFLSLLYVTNLISYCTSFLISSRRNDVTTKPSNAVKAGQTQNLHSSKGMCSIMPKWLRNLRQIFKVPKQHLGPIPEFKFHALQYLYAFGLGQQVHSAVVTQAEFLWKNHATPREIFQWAAIMWPRNCNTAKSNLFKNLLPLSFTDASEPCMGGELRTDNKQQNPSSTHCT